jgi:3-methyladenine DNA glycosylase AlkD
VADENFWLRRAALLAHLLALRQGAGDWGRFVRYATQMLEDKDFFIRKAIGWVLREAGKATPQRVVEFLAANMEQVSGLTLREGAKHLAPEDRDRLLEAHRHR